MTDNPWMNQPDVTPYPTEGETVSECYCWECNPDMQGYRMFLCLTCGNKRCPRATDHRRQCTGSNAVNQTGSRYSEDWPEARLGKESE